MKGYAHSLNIYNAEVVYIRPYDTEELGAAFDFSFDFCVYYRTELSYYIAVWQTSR